METIGQIGRRVFGWRGWREFQLLAAITAVVGGIWIFAAIAEEVLEGDAHHFDNRVMMALRVDGDPSHPVGQSWLPEAARDVTALGSYSIVTLVTVLVVGFLLLQGMRGEALLVLVVVSGGGLLSQVLKSLFQRERPAIGFRLEDVSTLSFPSGHSMLSSIVYITLGALLARTLSRRNSRIYCFCVGLLLAGLVGLTRVYLGVHFPTDVLAGWAAGTAWAMLCWIAMTLLQRRGTLEKAGNADVPEGAGRD